MTLSFSVFHKIAAITALAVAAPSCATTTAVIPPGKAIAIEPITSMRVAVDRALSMADRHGAEKVLVVFDIDSTLLRDAGRSPDLDPLKEADPVRFRQIERTVMYLKPLIPTEPGLVDELARLNGAKIATYALTARGTDMRDMTLRELEANAIAFPLAPECGPPLCTVRGNIPEETVLAAARSVLGDAELARVGFDDGRSVSVSNGVVMAAGLDKGVLLRILMASLGRTYQAVVFVDDADHNVADVSRASAAMTEQIAIFHYDGPDLPQLRSQADVEAAWSKTSAAICDSFAPRWCQDGR